MSRAILPEPPAELKQLSRSLSSLLRTEITSSGPLPFARFMERALYEPGLGYYSAGLHKLGINVASPKATFYVWFEVPAGYTSATFAGLLLDKGGIMATPGNGFGDPGEGYVRMALTVSRERLAEAVDRMAAIGF